MKGILNTEALEATIEKAREWREDATLKDVHARRNSAGKSTILVFPQEHSIGMDIVMNML